MVLDAVSHLEVDAAVVTNVLLVPFFVMLEEQFASPGITQTALTVEHLA